MPCSPRLLALAALVAPLAAFAADTGTASGTMDAAGTVHRLAHAVAWVDPHDPASRVVLASTHPPDPAGAADGHYIDAELMGQEGGFLTVNFAADGSYVHGIRTRDLNGSGADFRCEGEGLLTLTRNDAARIAGTFACEEHEVTFDAPILQGPG